MNKATDLLLSDFMLRECWEAHQAFRRLNFAADDIFVVLGLNVAVMLRAQDKEFTVNLGVHPNGSEWFGSHWSIVAQAQNDGDIPESLLDRIWEQSPYRNNPLPFLMALKNKGFELPKGEPEQLMN